jgi:O-antigen ligase
MNDCHLSCVVQNDHATDGEAKMRAMLQRSTSRGHMPDVGSTRISNLASLLIMTFGLALFYRTGALPILVALPLILLGLAIFGVVTLRRPDLGLLFVPLTAPLYLIPALIPGIRASGFLLPLHEVVLLGVAGATLARWLWSRRGRIEVRPAPQPSQITGHVLQWAPQLLFLLAGGLGVLIAVERGPALREFRWLIAEPLLFYALVHFFDRRSPITHHPSPTIHHLIKALILAGAIVAAVGLLQFVGLDLAWIFGTKTTSAFAENTVADNGVLRVTSVYGNPNNLGLALGRIWPLAAALALVNSRTWPTARAQPSILHSNPVPDHAEKSKIPILLSLSVVLILAGIAVSFSRGAFLGVAAALLVLGVGCGQSLQRVAQSNRGSDPVAASPVRARWLWLLPGLVIVIAGIALLLRGGLAGGSTGPRVLIWREALALIQLHPFGLGLDQFYYYHNPAFGRSLIDPALIGTSEQYAAHPHNLLLDTWLRLGPLGVLAFGWVLVRFFQRGVAVCRYGDRTGALLALATLAAMAAALVHGMVDNVYFVPDLAIIFWLLIALVDKHPSP